MHDELLRAAETARRYSLAETKVGAALRSADGSMRLGTNLEQHWCNSVHAAVAAIVGMVSAGGRRFTRLAIVCHRPHFTPCGSCIDWMTDYSIPNAEIIVSDGKIATSFTLDSLMPYYPGATTWVTGLEAHS